MKSIYKEGTYIFSVTIKVNDVLANIAADVVTAVVDKKYSNATPLIQKDGDVASYGSVGKVVFEFTPTDTNITDGNYQLQIVWQPDGTSRKFVIIDTLVTIKPQIKDW